MHLKKAAIRLLCLILAAFCFMGTDLSINVYDNLPGVDVQAKAAILVYAQTGEILYQHNIHVRREPASITKIMTCLVAIEQGNLDELVTVQKEDFFDIGPDSSVADLQEGDVLTLRDLLYCAMLRSANEACNVIARHIAGSVPDFMALVNQRLAEIGCTNSNYTNTHGLPDVNHYTTAYDISLMVAECLKNQVLADIAKVVTYTLPPTARNSEGYKFTTTNRLMQDHSEYYYEPALGLKTGSTNAAGYCLASYAKRKGDDRVLIAVVLGAVKEEGENGKIRSFTESRDLLEWGFKNFQVKNLISRNAVVDETPVLLGLDKDSVGLVTEGALDALVPATLERESLTLTVTRNHPDGIEAPLSRGALMGTLTVSYQGRTYGTVNLLANESIEKDSREEFAENIGGFFDQAWIRWVLIIIAAIVVLYIALVVFINHQKRQKRRPPGNYKGKKRR